MKKILFAGVFLFIILSFAKSADARSGCCSSHDGVCGCGCCDGTSLSATCAPYYPNCYATYTTTTIQKPILTVAPKVKININSDSYLDTNYYDSCRLKNSTDKYLYRYRGENYYDGQCSLLTDAATEKFVVDNGIAKTSTSIHYWSYILLKYKTDIK